MIYAVLELLLREEIPQDRTSTSVWLLQGTNCSFAWGENWNHYLCAMLGTLPLGVVTVHTCPRYTIGHSMCKRHCKVIAQKDPNQTGILDLAISTRSCHVSGRHVVCYPLRLQYSTFLNWQAEYQGGQTEQREVTKRKTEAQDFGVYIGCWEADQQPQEFALLALKFWIPWQWWWLCLAKGLQWLISQKLAQRKSEAAAPK